MDLKQFNPSALRKAKIVCSFGLSECSRVNKIVFPDGQKYHLKFSRRLKVKVTHEGQMMKWSSVELFRATTSTFIHGFQNKLAHFYL